MSSNNSFSSLLAAELRPISSVSRGSLGDRIAERTGSGVPKFKSLPLPSPLSPPGIVSPSSFFAIPFGLSPAELLDSPVFLSSSSILPSPTTGTFPIGGFNWKNEYKNNLDFSFQTEFKPLESYKSEEQTWDYEKHAAKQDSLSLEKANLESEFNSMQSFSPEIASIQTVPQVTSNIQSDNSEPPWNKRSEDGYNWRKYGQKQVKGSENPRSYYKCTYPGCPTKKKVESSLTGQITEIVYRGSHNHPKPQVTRRPSSLSVSASSAVQSNHRGVSEMVEHYGSGNMDSSATENSTVTVGDDDFEQSSHSKNGLVADDLDENEPDAKRWKGDTEDEGISGGVGRTVREPRVVVQTRSDIDILDDGYRWRKYGQKVVRGNPNPRSYYKCTNQGCNVRKHVERASQDAGAVITTYEGKHNHDTPPARGSGSRLMTKPEPSNTGNYGSMPQALLNNLKHQMHMRGIMPPVVEPQVPYTLQMLPSPTNFGNTQPNRLSYRAKNEPGDDNFLDSFLC